MISSTKKWRNVRLRHFFYGRGGRGGMGGITSPVSPGGLAGSESDWTVTWPLPDEELVGLPKPIKNAIIKYHMIKKSWSQKTGRSCAPRTGLLPCSEGLLNFLGSGEIRPQQSVTASQTGYRMPRTSLCIFEISFVFLLVDHKLEDWFRNKDMRGNNLYTNTNPTIPNIPTEVRKVQWKSEKSFLVIHFMFWWCLNLMRSSPPFWNVTTRV